MGLGAQNLPWPRITALKDPCVQLRNTETQLSWVVAAEAGLSGLRMIEENGWTLAVWTELLKSAGELINYMSDKNQGYKCGLGNIMR